MFYNKKHASIITKKMLYHIVLKLHKCLSEYKPIIILKDDLKILKITIFINVFSKEKLRLPCFVYHPI